MRSDLERVKKLISIVVPVYNVEKYLKQCLDSIIGQTYQNIEIILIDDGSTDRSGQICDKYAENDARIRVLHKENNGVSAARNSGIEMVSGEYLIFVDSDDRIHNKMIEIYTQVLEENQVLLCKITEDEMDLSECDQGRCRNMVNRFERQHFMQFYCGDHVNSPCDKLYDMEVIRKYHIRFDESISLGEDMLFNLEYFKYAPSEYKVIQCSLYYYRQRLEGSLVNSYRAELFELQLYMLNALREFLQENESWDIDEQKLFYGLMWNRLYLTIRIYQAYAKNNSDGRIRTVIKDSLNHSCWQTVERECWNLGLMNWKRILKKLHLEIMRRW